MLVVLDSFPLDPLEADNSEGGGVITAPTLTSVRAMRGTDMMQAAAMAVPAIDESE